MKDIQQRLSQTTILLHWLVGVGIIALMGVGLFMAKNDVYHLYPVHKSIGAILFIFILWRIIWRIINGFPQHVGQYSTIERVLSKVVHWVLLVGSLIYPVSGMMMSVMGGYGAAIFGLQLVAPNIVNGEPSPLNETLAGIGAGVHELITPIMIAAILLHIIGAYKHHLVDKDATLRRILGKSE